MKIGLEAERANLANPTGVEHYAAQLIKNLARIDLQNEYVLYFRTKPQQWFYSLPPNFKIRLIPFPKFWTQIRLSWEMLTNPVDLLVTLASVLPIIRGKKSIFTEHDAAHLFFPEAFPWFMRNYLRFSTWFAVRFATKIIAVSQSTKNDLVRHYNTPPEKVEVIYLGYDENQFKPLGYEEVQPVLDKFNLSYKKYILFLGTLQPRKNIIRLVDAFIQLKQKNHIEEKLVIAGGKGWLYDPIIKKIESANLKNDIRLLGYVDQADLPKLHNGATLLTLPALYEGFGLPPLESMACGTPVVVSNVSSLPEIVAEAGELVDPNSVDSIAAGLLKVLINNNLQQEMSQKGIERAKQFTWRATAIHTKALFESLK